jgi:C-terminal processing protease CtpA/Prc
MQEMGRARIIGTRTKGEVVPATFTKLPNNDVFLYATSSFTTQGGKVLEGVGITPDLMVSMEREALLQGKDPMKEAAKAWILEQS